MHGGSVAQVSIIPICVSTQLSQQARSVQTTKRRAFVHICI